MSLAGRAEQQVRRGLRIAHNLPLASSVALRHIGWDAAHAQLIGLRALPGGARRRVASSAALPPVTTALAMAADGRRADAATLLESVGAGAVGPGGVRSGGVRSSAVRSSTARLRRAVAAACALDDAELAARLLSRLPADDPAADRLAALVAARRGDLRLAQEAAERAGRPGRRLRRRVSAELAALQPEPLPPTATATTATTSATASATSSGTAQPLDGERILHLVTNALPEVQAGYTVRTQDIAAAQRRIGRDAQVATRLGFPVTAGAVAAAAEVEVDGVPYHRLLPARPLPRLDDARLLADVRATDALVRRLRPTVLHAHSKHVNAQVALAVGRDHGLPVVYEVRGFLEETWRSRGGSADSDLYRLSRDLETWCMQQADAVVALSQSMRDDILARGLPAERVHVVPNAVHDGYLAEPGSGLQARAELGIPADALVVGSISTLNDYEGLDLLVDATAELRAAGSPAHLLVVGDGPARHALVERARAAGLGEHATFTGRVPRDVAQRAHLALDVFCVPRRGTPVTRLVPPLKPLEAMASGRPVVASDLPPLRETVQDGVTGVLVPPDDARALAAGLKTLLYDVRTRQRMGQTARTWVLDHRTWHQAARWYDTLYERLRAHPTTPQDATEHAPAPPEPHSQGANR
ncbi:glycosyltransferase family 4 protein [Angustibacter sp. McL0619]|uniref:glycosyltransferase family 4 protein n=1 Tax=Angustibacter sp. McL0619 TaxID=3415676 RepID=UPI003CF85841